MRVVYVSTPEMAEKLFRFRYEQYVSNLKWFRHDDYPDGLVRDSFEDFSHNYIALDEHGMIIGSIRITMDSHDGLPLENCITFVELRNGRALAQLGRLVIEPKYYAKGLGAILMKTGYKCAVRYGVTHIVMSVSQGIQDLYRKMGFVQIGDKYLDWLCPITFSVTMVLDCIAAQKEWSSTHPRLYRFFTTPDYRIEHPE